MTDHRTDDRWGDPSDTRGRGRGRGLLAGLFVLLVLGGLYVAAASYLGDRVAARTTVGGIAVGGMSQAEARTALESGTADAASAPISVKGPRSTRSLDPGTAGLAVDYDASLDGLTGFSLDPRDVWAHVRGGVARPLETSVDDTQLAAGVATLAKAFDRKAVEGSVSISDGKVVTRKSSSGVATEQEDLARQIAEGWPSARTFTAPTTEVAPVLAQREIDRFVADDLEPLASGPVVVKTTDPTGQGTPRPVTFSVPAADLLPAVKISSTKGRLSATIDEAKISAAVVAAGEKDGALRPAVDATVTAKGSTSFAVTPSRSGLALKKDAIAAPVIAAMGKDGDARTATIASSSVTPELTTAQARSSLPKERISTFTTTLPDNPTRTHNIKTAGRVLDGTYVAPGETFSLNALLGQRTAAKGYNEAPVIINGRLRSDYGGGISQLSTTLFNAIFFSGAKIEEYHPHSFYIGRYPEGREATISWPDVDNRFTNDTKGGILISAQVSDTKVTVSFYGVKTYDVEASKGPRRNVVQPKVIKDSGAGCVPQSPSEGFDVTVTRTMKPVGGGAAKVSTFNTHYIPEDSVTCS